MLLYKSISRYVLKRPNQATAQGGCVYGHRHQPFELRVPLRPCAPRSGIGAERRAPNGPGTTVRLVPLCRRRSVRGKNPRMSAAIPVHLPAERLENDLVAAPTPSRSEPRSQPGVRVRRAPVVHIATATPHPSRHAADVVCIVSYTNRNTDFTEKFVGRVDN